MSRAGKRVVVIDAPFARPAGELNGVQVTNWGTHDTWSWRRCSAPSSLIEDVVARFGDHPVPYCDAEARSLADYENLRAGLVAGAQRKTAVLRHFLSMEDWDFFFGVFSESHCAGHQFWHFMDPGHPRHDASAPGTLRSAVRDVYRTIDAGLAAILQDLPADVPVFVFLSHGMGPYFAGSHLLGAVLERLGLSGTSEAADFPDRGTVGILWKLRRVLPPKLRQALKARLPTLLAALWRFAHPVQSLWRPGMRAFALPSHNMTGAIRINVKGREPLGVVAPGLEYETLCEELMAKLLELENSETGKLAVQWVRRARDLYEGARVEEMPDLFVEWDHSAPINALRSSTIGTVNSVLAADRTGDHSAHGLLLGRGPGFRRGEVGQIRMQDVAPTLLELLDLPIPSDYEGRSAAASLRSSARLSASLGGAGSRDHAANAPSPRVV